MTAVNTRRTSSWSTGEDEYDRAGGFEEDRVAYERSIDQLQHELRAFRDYQSCIDPDSSGYADQSEVIAYDDFVYLRGETDAKSAGKLKAEGKDYILQDGDVMHFSINV